MSTCRLLNATEAYRALAPAVLGYLRSLRVPDPEDTLGDVFLSVARDIGKFKGDAAALRRWVFSIAHNRATDAHRRRARRPVEAEMTPAAFDAVASSMPASDPSGPSDPFDPELVEALAKLSPDQREVVVLRFVADLPLADVARITGRRVGAVKALQHRALENLSKAVSREAVASAHQA